MRKISAKKIKEVVSRLCIVANMELRRDVLGAIKRAMKSEKNERARGILKEIIANAAIAKKENLPICQDTGMAEVFCEIGQNAAITGGDLSKAINDGVREGYKKGYLRKSVVRSPIIRKNTGTNAPAVVHTEIVPGDKIRITVAPKGFGSENKSRIKMFRPTAPLGDIKAFVLGVVKECGADACPPLVLGIGIGGTFEKAAVLSKLALLRPLNKRNKNKYLNRLEEELLNGINGLGIGPMALGGRTTALGVNILEFPTHIAGLPVAVSVSCHATRSATKII